MLVSALLTSAIVSGMGYGSHPMVAVLGRSLTWDPKGAYGLDADAPLTPASRRIVGDLNDAERGRAEALARYRLGADPDDLVPAWVLSQILRVRKGALAEYHASIEHRSDASASLPNLLFRLHVCRIAEWELPPAQRTTRFPVFRQLDRRLVELRDLLKPYAHDRLGVAIGVTQVTPMWSSFNREVLEAYWDAHLRGVDIRPLLCQAYLVGVGRRLLMEEPNHRLVPVRPTKPFPDEPRPRASLALSQAILKERPDDPLGHYYEGAGQAALGKTDLAIKEFGLAIKSGELPSIYEQGAEAFLAHPDPSVFGRLKVSY